MSRTRTLFGEKGERSVRRARSAVGYASRATGVDFEKYLVWGGIAAAIYFVVWPVLKTAISVKGAVDAGITSASNALASGLYKLFGPEEKFAGMTYNTLFPDGSHHMVPEERVSSSGIFVNSNLSPNYKGDGNTYRMLVRATNTPGQKYVAVVI